MNILPKNKPQIKKEDTEKIVKHYLGANPPALVLVGIRGYFSKSMGATQGNDMNLYDDAVLVWGLDTYKTYNFNTDPSFAKKNGRGLAKLNTGIYKFYKGKHKNKYWALRSYPEGVVLPCTREGKPATCSAINIHHGGLNNGGAGVTWSEGCQTLPPNQWAEFQTFVYDKMDKLGLKTITYILLTEEEKVSLLK